MSVISESKLEACEFGTFLGAYKYTRQGALNGGVSPDGRLVTQCERCLTCLLNVFVFANAVGQTMHVGIDCAAKMGVELSELRTARRYFSDSEKNNSIKNALEKRKAATDALVLANRELHKDKLAMLEDLSAEPNLSSFERSAIETNISALELGRSLTRDFLPAILTRLALCETSQALAVGTKLVSVTLTAYRAPVFILSQFGGSYINFLTDGINSFVYIGNSLTVWNEKKQDCDYIGGLSLNARVKFTGNWSVKKSETRDGLISTVLQRPSKLSAQCALS